MMRVFAALLLLPLVYSAAFWIYVPLADDPGCGSLEPGLCFGVGLTQLFSLPLALICTPIAIYLFLRDKRQRKATP